MSIRNVVTIEDKILRKISMNVDIIDDNIRLLLDDMKDTLEFQKGVGLAAVQVGKLMRIFIVKYNDYYNEFINPKILYKSKKSTISSEGCLSIPKITGNVVRPRRIEIEALDRNGKKFNIVAEEYLARIICHEYDHLDGILFVDKVLDKE